MDTLHEAARLNVLRQLNLLDTLPSESFDRITRMASQMFGLPVAAVSLTDSDRQWFKSRVGVDHCSIPRAKAPCGEVADLGKPLIINDFHDDPFYRDSPLGQSGIRFYAGAPLLTSHGFSLGAMCVLGTEPRTVTAGEIESLKDMAAMVMAQIELQHAFGRIDPVTGLPNRTQLVEDLQDLARDGSVNERRHLVLVDVASSEQLSEAVRAMGPRHVDELVAEAAMKITSHLGTARRAYHVATTQIALLSLPGIDTSSYLREVETWVGTLASSSSTRFLTTVAIGVAPFDLGTVEPVDLLRMAHSAAQDARRLETKVSLYSSSMDQRHRRRFDLVNDFGSALDATDQLRLLYQPRVDLASGRCIGVEALLRWTHPTMGNVSPGEFVPMIERTTLATRMTRWVLNEALRQRSHWHAAGIDLSVSVNVSATNLEESDFLFHLKDALDRHGVPVSGLEIEVTESAMMEDTGRALDLLTAIASCGIHIAIDDFGTGYSSLAYLQTLPAKVVKIDRSFMSDLCQDTRKQELVKAMIVLSHGFGYRVVAEGVETQEVLSIISAAGCDEVQGYFFAKPMDAERLVDWLSSHNHRMQRSSQAA